MTLPSLQATSPTASLFPLSSRYYGLAMLTYQASGEKPQAYLSRRFLPQPGDLATIQQHVVTQGDRLDNITARYLGDPEVFWRVADANNAMLPEALVEVPGRILQITLPSGIPNTRA